MHNMTYADLKPTDDQMVRLERLRNAAKVYGELLETELPEGEDKNHIIRAHRSNAMWATVAVTRLVDGAPRPPDHGGTDMRFAAGTAQAAAQEEAKRRALEAQQHANEHDAVRRAEEAKERHAKQRQEDQRRK
jgi:hypothetical protein